MKISIIYAALLTAVSIEAAAINIQDECYAPGGLCNTLKRAAEALGDTKRHENHKCMAVSAVCFKAKRDVCGTSCLNAKRSALALAEAFAEAAPFAGPAGPTHANHKCETVGAICWKAKRSVAQAADDLAEAEAFAASTPEDDTDNDDEEACNQAGGPCEAVKRAAQNAADAIAGDDPSGDGPPEYLISHECSGRGMACGKAKRAYDSLTSVIDSIL